MGIYSTLVSEKRSAVYDPIHPRDPALVRLFGGSRNSAAGVRVDDQTALSSTAMFAGVRFIAENMATVPLKLYRRDGRGKVALREDPRWALLQQRPNPEQTAVEFKEMLIGHVATIGNGYAEIVEGRGGIAEELWPLVPWRVRLARSQSGALNYLIRRPGDDKEAALPPERVLHFRGFSRTGLLGIDVIEQLKEAIGITLAADQAAAAFYGHGAQPSGYLKTDAALSDKAWNRLKDQRDRMHAGVENWHRLAMLEEGVTFQQISTDPEKSQLIQTRKFQIEEVARILNLPPHVLKSLERSTNNNIEHQGLELVTYTLRPWAVRLEQVYEARLLLPRERGTHLIRHNLGGFLRGDLAAQASYFSTARQWGWMSANDVRESLDENGIGPAGDIYLVPINMIPADMAGETVGGDDPPAGGMGGDPAAVPPARGVGQGERELRAARSALSRKRVEASWRPVYQQRMDGWIRREANAIRRAWERASKGGGVQEFLAWMDGFYEETQAFLSEESRPMFFGLATQIYRMALEEIGADDDESDLADWSRTAGDVYAERSVESSQGQLILLLRGSGGAFADTREVVEERLGGWEESRAGRHALRETVGVAASAAIAAWAAAGVLRKVWHTIGKSCPLCTSMHGRTASITSPFLAKGDEVAAEGVSPLRIERFIKHPQLHGGCDCTVIPNIGG